MRIVARLLLTVLLTSLIAHAGLSPRRTLEVERFVNMPISVKAVKNLQSKDWLRSLEVEVRNDSSKPIYYLSLGVIFPDIRGPVKQKNEFQYNDRYCFPLWWGTSALIHKKLASPDDISIKPGESHTFKVPEEVWRQYENYVSENKISMEATNRVLLVTRSIAYGDGTGFEGEWPFGLTSGLVVRPNKILSERKMFN